MTPNWSSSIMPIFYGYVLIMFDDAWIWWLPSISNRFNRFRQKRLNQKYWCLHIAIVRGVSSGCRISPPGKVPSRKDPTENSPSPRKIPPTENSLPPKTPTRGKFPEENVSKSFDTSFGTYIFVFTVTSFFCSYVVSVCSSLRSR